MAKSFPSLSIIWIQPIHNTNITFPAFNAWIDLLYNIHRTRKSASYSIQFRKRLIRTAIITNQHIEPIRKRKVIELMPHRSRHYQFTKSFKLSTKTSILHFSLKLETMRCSVTAWNQNSDKFQSNLFTAMNLKWFQIWSHIKKCAQMNNYAFQRMHFRVAMPTDYLLNL